MRAAGVPCLPPVEKEPDEDCPWIHPADAFLIWPKLKAWINAGAVWLVHMGTECKSFSMAPRDDGKGPRQTRDHTTLEPLERCTLKERDKVIMGTRMAVLSFEIAAHCVRQKTTGRVPVRHWFINISS